MRDPLPEAPPRPRVAGERTRGAPAATLVAALGNSLCGDDGAGPLVLTALERLGLPGGLRTERVGDPLLLIELWREEDEVVLLDAAKTSDAPAGARLTLDGLAAELPDCVHPVSSHGMNLAAALALARHLNRLPRSLTVHAIVGTEFERGAKMTGAVRAASERLARELHGALVPLAPLAGAA